MKDVSRSEDVGKSLMTTIITVDGLILALGWGMFNWKMDAAVKQALSYWLKWGATFLTASLVLAVLCIQFMVTAAGQGEFSSKSVMESRRVSVSFLLSYLCFFAGMVIMVVSIWRM